MVLETKRLILRPWKEDDAETLYEYAKDPLVGPSAGWPVHTSVENSREIIKHVLSASETYAVCLKEDNKAIGSIGLLIGEQSNKGIAQNEAEIGYWIGVPFWGQGFIPEATEEIIRYAFEDLGMKKLWCGYFDGNENSKRVQEKCGFQYQYTVKDQKWELINEIRTEHITCMTRIEWSVKSNYNYLNDVGTGRFSKESFVSKERKDPDILSEKLYEDLSCLFANQSKLPNGDTITNCKVIGPNKYGGYELEVEVTKENTKDKTVFILGSDYIGPPVHWAVEVGMNDKEIGEFLEVSRTIGGHLLWWKRSDDDNKKVWHEYEFWYKNKATKLKENKIKPNEVHCFNKKERDSFSLNEWNKMNRKDKITSIIPYTITVNTARGGKKGFYDRIDFTLFDLKQWYLDLPCKLQEAYENSKEWLLLFKDFKGFIDYFLLQDFVVENEHYAVKNLDSFDEGESYKTLSNTDVYHSSRSQNKADYKAFIESSLAVISKRNERIIAYITNDNR